MSSRPRLPRRALITAAGTAAVGLALSMGSPVAPQAMAAPVPAVPCDQGYQTFGFTGGLQTFTVPSGVSDLILTVVGASGGAGGFGTVGGGSTPGGHGAFLSVDGVSVVPGTVLTVLVGGAGGDSIGGGGGGGASYVYITPTPSGLLVAAGGGGGGLQGGIGGDARTMPHGAGGGSPDIGGGGGSLLDDGGSNSRGPGGGEAVVHGGAGGVNADAGGAGGFGGGGGAGFGYPAAGGALTVGSGGGGGIGGGAGGGLHGSTVWISGGGGSFSVVPPVSASATSTGNGLVSIAYGKPQTVTLNPNYLGAANRTMPVECGLPMTMPATPHRAGYTLTGWTTDPAGTSGYDFATPVTGPLTLYAQWAVTPAPPLQTVTFSENGGPASAPVTQQVPSSSTATDPGPQTRAGWVFGGWYTRPVGGTAWNFATPVTSPLTLYSQWTTATVNPTTSTPGSQITVTGHGFWPGERVRATLHTNAVDLGAFTADADGNLTFTARLPASLPAGTHTISLTGLTSGRTAHAGLTMAGAGSLAQTGVQTRDLAGGAALILLTGLCLLVVGIGPRPTRTRAR